MAVDTDFVNILGPFPILQLTAGIVILVVCAIVWMRGTRKQEPDDPLQTILRMDGPIAVAIGLLRQIAESTSHANQLSQQVAEEARNQRKLLEELGRRLENLKFSK